MHRWNKGFTLAELMVVIAIIAIVSTLAFPSYTQIRKKQEADQFHRDFYNAFQLARASVPIYHQPIVICGSSALGQLCDHNWNKGVAVFIDSNDNSQHDEAERVLSYVPSHVRFGVVKLKISLNKRIVKLSMSRGLVSGYTGKLIYCPDESTLIRALIWGHMGNTRLAQDSNADGIRDDNGEAINCS